MKPILLAVLAGLVAVLVAAPAAARVNPYLRADYSGSGLRMTAANQLIMQNQQTFQDAGLPANFSKVGAAYGPGVSAGLWLLPWFRVGGTYAYHKGTVSNRLHVPGQLFFADDLELRVREVGGEAALRFRRLGGLTIGGTVAQGRAQLVEGTSLETVGSQSYFDATGERTKPTWGGYIGIDQTNAAGVAGYLRFGFQYRDMSYMPSRYTLSDGVTSVTGTSETSWLDYSGFYLNVGVGYDLFH